MLMVEIGIHGDRESATATPSALRVRVPFGMPAALVISVRECGAGETLTHPQENRGVLVNPMLWEILKCFRGGIGETRWS